MRAVLSFLFGLFATTRRTVMLLAVVASLALNVATVTSTAVFTAVSATVSAVTGVSTVASRAIAERQLRKAAVRKTTKTVTKRVTRAAARNSASALGEAIPVAGAAVIAAALAWEIHDACATARDMAVLEAQLDDPALDPATVGFSCTDLIPEAESLPSGADLLAQARAAPMAAWEAMQSLYEDLPDDPATP